MAVLGGLQQPQLVPERRDFVVLCGECGGIDIAEAGDDIPVIAYVCRPRLTLRRLFSTGRHADPCRPVIARASWPSVSLRQTLR